MTLAICLSALTFSMITAAQQRFVANLSAAQEVPANSSTGTAVCTLVLNATQTQMTINCTYSGVSTPVQASHIHNAGPVGVNGPVKFNFNFTGGTSGTIGPLTFDITAQDVADLKAKKWYFNIHTTNFPGGEIRGQAKITTTPFDRDGDGRTDITVFRQSANRVYTLSSLTGGIVDEYFGSGTGDNYLNSFPSDFNGDGIADPLILKIDQGDGAAYWSYKTGNNTGNTVRWGSFLTANVERLVPGDYDGDGKQDVATFRAATGVWYILLSSTNTLRAVGNFGAANDVPQAGDFDGDGKTDLCVVRVEGTQRAWYIQRSSDGQSYKTLFGAATGDSISFFAQVDVDGDGRQDIMVSRAVNGQRVFYALQSSNGQLFTLPWGINTGVAATSDTSIVGDYDGDGKTDFVARRTENGVYIWYIYQSSTGTARAVQWGATGDQ